MPYVIDTDVRLSTDRITVHRDGPSTEAIISRYVMDQPAPVEGGHEEHYQRKFHLFNLMDGTVKITRSCIGKRHT